MHAATSGHAEGRAAKRDSGAGPWDVVSPENIGQFLALVAHELSAPQTVIASAAETLTLLLAQDEFHRDDVARITDVIRRQSHLSRRLVARLNMAFEIERGTVNLETEQFDLARLVEEIVSDVAAFMLPERTVKVSASSPVPAVVERAGISEIITNLLANADKYSAAGAEIEVHVDRDERHARVVVRDQGTGVAPDDTEAIFEPYVQAGPHRGGIGLGLYVSRGLARAQGGELSVQPAADVGSEFVLELPIDPLVPP